MITQFSESAAATAFIIHIYIKKKTLQSINKRTFKVTVGIAEKYLWVLQRSEVVMLPSAGGKHQLETWVKTHDTHTMKSNSRTCTMNCNSKSTSNLRKCGCVGGPCMSNSVINSLWGAQWGEKKSHCYESTSAVSTETLSVTQQRGLEAAAERLSYRFRSFSSPLPAIHALVSFCYWSLLSRRSSGGGDRPNGQLIEDKFHSPITPWAFHSLIHLRSSNYWSVSENNTG